MLRAAQDAAAAATRLVAAAERLRGRGRSVSIEREVTSATSSGSSFFPRTSFSSPTSLTGPCDPCWIEASHVTTRETRTVRVSFRCRAPPPSNESGAAGSAGLAGTLRIGTHGALCFADGFPGVAVELSGVSAKASAASAARDVVGISGLGADGGTAFGSVSGNAGHVGRVARRVGRGADEETVVTVDVRVRAFERVGLRAFVTYPDPSNRAASDIPGISPADIAPVATMRCLPYRFPLADFLDPDDDARDDPNRFERLWSALPESFELAARVDLDAAASDGYDVPDARQLRGLCAPDARRAVLDAAVFALGGDGGARRFDPAGALRNRGDGSRDGFRRRPFARCGGYALGSSGAACERFAATTWDGEHILCVLFASGDGVRLEYRARSAKTLAPIAADPELWLAETAGAVLVVADFESDVSGDASLFRPAEELLPEVLARGPLSGDGVRLRDAAAREWKAMAVA
jgi:hypothetical protein